MRVIPVLDLTGGVAVHARRGNRSQYRPVESRLAPGSSDPLQLCKAFREVGFSEVYIADLDAIAGRGEHRDAVREIVAETGLGVLLDAGVRTVHQVAPLLELGVSGVLVGSETLASLAELPAVLALAGPERVLFSLDMRAGQVLSPDPGVAGADPLEVLTRVAGLGVTQAVAIELAAVGAESGPDLELARAASAALPGFALLVGGGARHAGDLAALQAAGAAGSLIATCLHTGALSAEEARQWLAR